MRPRDGGCDASPGGDASAHAYRSEPDSPTSAASHTPLGRNKTVGGRLNRQLSRNETIRPRDRAPCRTLQPRPPNREALNDQLAPPTVPQRTADRPEHTVKRGEQNSEARPEENDARVDDEPFHREAHRARASTTTTREPIPRSHATRIVERARKRDTIAETHFRSDLSGWMGKLVCCC